MIGEYMEKIKIGYFADGSWGVESLKRILKDKNISINFICLRYNSEDQDIKKIAKNNKIDCFTHKDINSYDFLKRIKKYKSDLFVSMSFDQIFKENIINLPKYNIINCHAGKLPFYRGRNVLNWVLINDENEFGITVHYVDKGIDTGDIILQESYKITDDDTYATLLKRSYQHCSNLLIKAINKIRNNNIRPIKQEKIHPVGFYCGRRGSGDELLSWNQTSREVFNFVRAICKPGPMARTFLNNKEMKINKVTMIKNAPNYKSIVGQILKKTKKGFIVKTKDSIVEVIDYYYKDKIKVGSRFSYKKKEY